MNFTLVAPVKFAPVKATLAPTCPLVGEKLVIVGAAALTVKLLAEVAVPCGVTIKTFPVTAPLGTVAVTLVALTTVNVAAAPPIVTELAPLKCVPVIVTIVPTLPLAGLKLLMAGVAVGCGGGGALVLPPPHPRNIPAHAIAKKIAATTIARGILFRVLRGVIGLRRNMVFSLIASCALAERTFACQRMVPGALDANNQHSPVGEPRHLPERPVFVQRNYLDVNIRKGIGPLQSGACGPA